MHLTIQELKTRTHAAGLPPVEAIRKSRCSDSFAEIVITSIGEMIPDLKTFAELTLVIPVFSVATDCRFNLHYVQAGVQLSSMQSVHATAGEMFIVNIYVAKSAQCV